MVLTRRQVLALGVSSALVTPVIVATGWKQGWSLAPKKGIQTARLLIALAHQDQTNEGSILGNLYLTNEFARGILAAELDPKVIRTSQGTSVYDYFARQLDIDSVGSRQVTDSISRLQTTVLLGLNSDYRRGEALYLIEKRVRDDEQGFLSLQNPGDSLAYLPFGMVALQVAGVDRQNALLGRMRVLIEQLRNPDGGYPEVPGGPSVADMSAAVILAGADLSDGLTQRFLKSLLTPEGFRYSREESPEFRSPVATSALVQQAWPGEFNIPDFLMSQWYRKGNLGQYPSREEEIYDLCVVAQALGHPLF